jgi:type IV pilus assembly protein PilM
MKSLYNKYFPTPKYLAMNSCGIDISDQSVKYGELVMTSSGLKLSKYGKEKIPEGAVVSGKIEKEDELVLVLKKIKDKEKLHFVRVALPEEQMYLFTLSLPKTKDAKLSDMVLLQIEEHIPLKAVDCTFSYDVISEDSENIFVEVIAIANSILDGYISVFEKADLVPTSFEIEAQAISRAVIPKEEDSTIMIVDFGDARTGVSISKNGRVFLTTTLSIGGIDLTNMIAKNFSISFSEAEKMKHEYGLNQIEKNPNIFGAILNGISVLRDELNRQYLYWGTHNTKKEEQINHIILCGGDANLSGLAEYLELSMKIKVENANVWTNVLNKENIVPEMSFEESLSYATVVGLSLGNYSYDKQTVINLLPESVKKSLLREYWMRFSTILFDLITFMIFSASLLLFPAYFFSQAKEDLVENRLALFNKENPELLTNNIDNIINDINSKIVLLDKNLTTSYSVSDKIFGTILSSRTNGITFSQMFFNKKVGEDSVLEVHGIAKDRDSLRNFKTSLDSNTSFSSVELPISNFLEKTDLPFTVLLKIK